MNSKLARFKFADGRSVMIAERALNPDRPSAFLIVGPPCAGKTKLAKLILSSVFGCVPGATSIGPREDFRRVVDRAADHGFLFLDNVTRVDRLHAPALLAFLTSREWEFRRFRKPEITKVLNNCLTVVTTSDDKISEDLSRRFLIIRLAAST